MGRLITAGIAAGKCLARPLELAVNQSPVFLCLFPPIKKLSDITSQISRGVFAVSPKTLWCG
jgi:hypothetical protein